MSKKFVVIFVLFFVQVANNIYSEQKDVPSKSYTYKREALKILGLEKLQSGYNRILDSALQNIKKLDDLNKVVELYKEILTNKIELVRIMDMDGNVFKSYCMKDRDAVIYEDILSQIYFRMGELYEESKADDSGQLAISSFIKAFHMFDISSVKSEQVSTGENEDYFWTKRYKKLIRALKRNNINISSLILEKTDSYGCTIRSHKEILGIDLYNKFINEEEGNNVIRSLIEKLIDTIPFLKKTK